MGNLGSGYLYNWGIGFSGENSIPNELTGAYANFIGVGNTFNAAQIIDIPATQTLSNNLDFNNAKSKFGFLIYNPNIKKSPLKRLEISSSFSGTGNASFISGNQFLGKVAIITNGGLPGIKNDRAVMSLGRTLGSGSGRYVYPSDTFIFIRKNNLRYKEYDTWSGDYNLFSGYNFTGYFETGVFKPFSGVDAGAIIRDIGGVEGSLFGLNNFEINYGPIIPIQSGTLIRQDFLFQDLGTIYPTGEILLPNQNKIWASYDIKTGMVNNTRNVFAYAFQFIDIATTRDSGIVITSGSTSNPFESYRQLEMPLLTSGFDTSFSNYIGYCFNRLSCDSFELPPEDIQICYTGESITGSEYRSFISGVLKQYASEEYTNETDATSNLQLSSGTLVSSLFTYQTGQIYFNNFFTGDRIIFNLYNFDYTGEYKSYHLNNNPPYPSTGFTLTYPQDFTNINNLTSILNSKLKNINQQVWYPYDCLSGEASGIYISGGLMSFEIFSGSGAANSGDKNYNNIINYYSLRNYQRGFDLRLDLVNRDEYVEDLYLKTYKEGFSYLIPNVVELQGLSGTQWIVLDRRSGLYKSLTGLESTQIKLDADPDLFLNSGEDYLNSSDIIGNNEVAVTGIEEIIFSGEFKPLQKFKQTTYSKAPPYCSVQTLERQIDIVQAINWPVGYDPCKEQPEEEDKGEESPVTTSAEKDKLELFLNVKRTGWLLEPTGRYLTCITGPDYDPSKIKFSGYRVVMRNFSGLAPNSENIYIKPREEVYISNINLFSLETNSLPVHSGEAQCLIGSEYTVDVGDIVAVPITYNFEYTITGEDRTGIFRAVNYPIVYPLRSFYITGNPVSNVNQVSPGGLNTSTTGYFTLDSFANQTKRLSSGSLLHIRLSTGTAPPFANLWGRGKAARWECGNDGINFSGFQLYNNGTGYFSGRATGDGGLGVATYTGYLPRNADYFRVVSPVTGTDPVRLSYTGWSGYYDFSNIKFVRESGRFTDNLTGLINGVFTGSGLITHTFGDKYFYNPSTSKVYFREDISGNFNRSGILSGQFNVIKDYVINQELLVGGRLSSTTDYYEKYYNGLLTGLLTGINYFQPDVQGLFLLTGQVTGFSTSGYYLVTGDLITGSGIYINDDNYPYYPVYTGLRQSKGTITINLNTVRNFDILNLNNTTISFHNETGLFFAPDFFNSVDTLINIINTNVDIFYSTGQKISNSGIEITALADFAPGYSGNSIILTGNSNSFTFSSSTLTGGKTFYPILYPTTNFSGRAYGSIASTGFYTVTGSGIITGNVSTFTGIRTFTGIWDLKTGNNQLLRSFLGNNWISGNRAYLNSGRFANTLNNLKLQVFYDNELNTFDSEGLDVVNLKITDNNYNLLPNPPAGETTSYIFKITGVKNI